jgi:hypothetical protein
MSEIDESEYVTVASDEPTVTMSSGTVWGSPVWWATQGDNRECADTIPEAVQRVRRANGFIGEEGDAPSGAQQGDGEEESVCCTCEWASPEDGSVGLLHPHVLDPYCCVHGAPADFAPGREFERVYATPPVPSQQGAARETDEGPGAEWDRVVAEATAREREEADRLTVVTVLRNYAQSYPREMNRLPWDGIAASVVSALRSAPAQDHAEAYAALAAIRQRHNGYNAEMRAALPDLKEPASPAEALDDLLAEERSLALADAIARDREERR